jgi:hypothetical protein
MFSFFGRKSCKNSFTSFFLCRHKDHAHLWNIRTSNHILWMKYFWRCFDNYHIRWHHDVIWLDECVKILHYLYKIVTFFIFKVW